MIDNPVIFYIASVFIIGFAISSMLIKNIIYSLICAVMVFFAASIFFYMLGSEYNAIIQAAIYGFAVPVIIGISIMFTANKQKKENESVLPTITLFAAILFAMSIVYVIIISLAMLPNSFNLTDITQNSSYDVISKFAKGLFIDYVWAFELFSLLLTVIIAGFTIFRGKVLKKGGEKNV